MASILLVGFWIAASFCILLGSVILTISAKVSQAFEDLLLYGKVRNEQRKWSVVQLIEVPKRCDIDQLIYTRSSVIAEGQRDAIVSRNLATVKHPI